MDIDLKIPARPGGEVKIPANERKPIPQNEQPIQPLKEGDMLSEWSEWTGPKQEIQKRYRYVVGDTTCFDVPVLRDRRHICKFCKTISRQVREQTQYRRVGRDKVEYVYEKNENTRDEICPKCGYRWQRSSIW